MDCNTCGARGISNWTIVCPSCGAELQEDRTGKRFEDEEIEAAMMRHPSSFDPDDEIVMQQMEDRYEKYLDRMLEHGS